MTGGGDAATCCTAPLIPLLEPRRMNQFRGHNADRVENASVHATAPACRWDHLPAGSAGVFTSCRSAREENTRWRWQRTAARGGRTPRYGSVQPAQARRRRLLSGWQVSMHMRLRRERDCLGPPDGNPPASVQGRWRPYDTSGLLSRWPVAGDKRRCRQYPVYLGYCYSEKS
jgi:hypothetical protein